MVRWLGLDWAGFVRQLFFSGQQGQFVFIRDDRSSEDYFGVCEVQVFRFKGIKKNSNLEANLRYKEFN